MSYRTRITFTRPSTSVDWYRATTDFDSYLQSQYIDSGKLTNKTVTVSADELTLTITREWDSEESLEDFLADSTYNTDLKQPSELYNAENNISRTFEHDV